MTLAFLHTTSPAPRSNGCRILTPKSIRKHFEHPDEIGIDLWTSATTVWLLTGKILQHVDQHVGTPLGLMFQTARSWWCEGQKKVFGGEAAESLLAVSGDTATLCHTWLWYSVVELKMLANRCYLATSSSDICFRPNSQDQRTFNCVPFTRSKPVNWAKQQQELSQQPCCNANIDSANFSEI